MRVCNGRTDHLKATANSYNLSVSIVSQGFYFGGNPIASQIFQITDHVLATGENYRIRSIEIVGLSNYFEPHVLFDAESIKISEIRNMRKVHHCYFHTIRILAIFIKHTGLEAY